TALVSADVVTRGASSGVGRDEAALAAELDASGDAEEHGADHEPSPRAIQRKESLADQDARPANDDATVLCTELPPQNRGIAVVTGERHQFTHNRAARPDRCHDLTRSECHTSACRNGHAGDA